MDDRITKKIDSICRRHRVTREEINTGRKNSERMSEARAEIAYWLMETEKWSCKEVVAAMPCWKALSSPWMAADRHRKKIFQNDLTTP